MSSERAEEIETSCDTSPSSTLAGQSAPPPTSTSTSRKDPSILATPTAETTSVGPTCRSPQRMGKTRYKPRLKRKATGIVPSDIPQEHDEDEGMTDMPTPLAEKTVPSAKANSCVTETEESSITAAKVSADIDEEEATEATLSDDAALKKELQQQPSSKELLPVEDIPLTPQEQLHRLQVKYTLACEELLYYQKEIEELEFRCEEFIRAFQIIRRETTSEALKIKEQEMALYELKQENECLVREKAALVQMIGQITQASPNPVQ